MDQRQHKPDSVQPDVISLIAKQRLLRLAEGGKFLKYTAKGQRIKDKYWLCKLSPNHRTLHYGDLEDGKDKTLDELPNRINVSDIKKILIGKDCPHTKDGHTKKTTIDLAFTIVYESDHEDFLNFVAIDHKTYSYWTDGLNALVKAPMTSEEFQKDLEILSRIELKMRNISTKCS
jgi:engulfment/cell motility protein 1